MEDVELLLDDNNNLIICICMGMYLHTHTHMFMETKKLHHKTFSTDNQNQLIFRIQNNIQKKRWDTREIAKWVLAHCSKYWLTIRVLAATVADWALVPSFNMVAQKHLSLQFRGISCTLLSSGYQIHMQCTYIHICGQTI